MTALCKHACTDGVHQVGVACCSSRLGQEHPAHPLCDVTSTSTVRTTLHRVFAGVLEAGGIVKALRVPDGQRLSNARLKPKGDVFGARPSLPASLPRIPILLDREIA